MAWQFTVDFNLLPKYMSNQRHPIRESGYCRFHNSGVVFAREPIGLHWPTRSFASLSADRYRLMLTAAAFAS